MNREQAVSFMTTIAGEHLYDNPATGDGTDVDLDALVGACVDRFDLDREGLPLAIWDWAIEAAARYYSTVPVS